jgi:hypothetical protein
MARDLSRARAILIGNAGFDSQRINDLPAARRCVTAMAELLEGQLCGWPADRITKLVDVAAPHVLARQVLAAVRDAEDVLLLYYVGHGMTTRNGRLALAVGETDPDPEALPYSSMLYENLADIMRGCRAATKLVILDCCHAELGGKANYVFQGSDLAEAYPVDGLYFVGASKKYEKAKSPVDEGLTYFTQAFVDVVRGGIAGQAEELRLDQIFLELRARLVRANLPEPVDSGIRGARQFPFARNAQSVNGEPVRELPAGAEQQRIAGFGQLEDGLRQASDWYLWGPYLSERQWATVREDYSADGQAWDYFPHDHARSRAYRWGEDGLAGFCDVEQRLCLGLALWNGRDPVLKERAFGLTGPEGNHGEDVKEHWWYLDAVPSHAWNRWRYHYPQSAFPYAELRAENARRSRRDPEYELLDTGVFDDNRYWIVEVCYAKADPTDLLMTVTVTNQGPETDILHVLPTAWFRNTWSWDQGSAKPIIAATAEASARIEHPFLGQLELLAGEGPDGAAPTLLFCENETNVSLLFGAAPETPYPKDGINDHVIRGSETVSPDRSGTKCAIWYKLEVPARGTVELRLRLRPRKASAPGDDVSDMAASALGQQFEQVVAARRADADEFYAGLTPEAAGEDQALVMRQAFSALLWSKQFYNYDVARWLDGDPGQPAPPSHRHYGRNARWRHLSSFDIMSVPDKWEYPWFASWELAFHCVALAHLDPAFAKYQLVLLLREWFQNPSGALPAYEWDFSDVNPPVLAWAALEVFSIDGGHDADFLLRVFDKLHLHFTWWANREDAAGDSLYEGAALGLDNLGPIDRSHLPSSSVMERADATGWMAFYALGMTSIAAILIKSGQRSASDRLLGFLERFASISEVIDGQGLWDEADGLYYDRLLTAGGDGTPVKVRSIAGMLPMLGVAIIDDALLSRPVALGKRFTAYFERRSEADDGAGPLGGLDTGTGNRQTLLSAVPVGRLQRMLRRMFDEGEFLSPHGLRSLSAYHREHPFAVSQGGFSALVDYEPAESTTSLFGGNSNWRGPLWFPLNFLVVSTLERYHQFFGQEFTLEYPTGSGRQLPLDAIAADLQDRLISIFLAGPDGRRPCFGATERLQSDPAWKDNLVFSEYFHADHGAGLGASHQTGWTALVADLIRRRHGQVPSAGRVTRQALPAGVQQARG